MAGRFPVDTRAFPAYNEVEAIQKVDIQDLGLAVFRYGSGFIFCAASAAPARARSGGERLFSTRRPALGRHAFRFIVCLSSLAPFVQIFMAYCTPRGINWVLTSAAFHATLMLPFDLIIDACASVGRQREFSPLCHAVTLVERHFILSFLQNLHYIPPSPVCRALQT